MASGSFSRSFRRLTAGGTLVSFVATTLAPTVAWAQEGQESVAEICRRHGITQSMYYEWQEAVFKAAEEGLTHGGRTAREAELEKQLRQAQRTIGRLTMENELYQKKQDWLARRQKKS